MCRMILRFYVSFAPQLQVQQCRTYGPIASPIRLPLVFLVCDFIAISSDELTHSSSIPRLIHVIDCFLLPYGFLLLHQYEYPSNEKRSSKPDVGEELKAEGLSNGTQLLNHLYALLQQGSFEKGHPLQRLFSAAILPYKKELKAQMVSNMDNSPMVWQLFPSLNLVSYIHYTYVPNWIRNYQWHLLLNVQCLVHTSSTGILAAESIVWL